MLKSLQGKHAQRLYSWQSRSQSPRSLWSAETTRLDLWDNPKPDAKFWLPVSRAHVRACSKVHKVSMRNGYIPGRKGAKITSLPLAPALAPTRPDSSMNSDDRCQSPRRRKTDLLGARFKSLCTLSDLIQTFGSKRIK